MGVPALFRWLTQKYPLIISPVAEDDEPVQIDGVDIPQKPPDRAEDDAIDNLYLDMNGIVHPCSHPEDGPAPETEEQMMLAVFKYTDRVVKMASPRKLLMIAVDGVAPRAKMNQQRSRRFRSAQEASEKDAETADLLAKLVKKDKKTHSDPLDRSQEAQIVKKTWDSNSITPGTPFMEILALSIRYWVAYKLNSDPRWAQLKIIISDATVKGEGEHKIMEYVRAQRRSPGYDPNTKHCIYGLDADLIMLGLATHEVHFKVLREDVFANDSKPRTCRLCGQVGHYADSCQGLPKEKQGQFDEHAAAQLAAKKPFIWLHVSVLREYLEVELYFDRLPFKFDLERAIDDWVFMCFFVGNDFLPHLPSLEIRDKGIDTLISIWKDCLPIMGGYVTKDGVVDLARAQHILAGLGQQEKQIFRRRKEAEDRRAAAMKRRADQQAERKRARDSTYGPSAAAAGPGIDDAVRDVLKIPAQKRGRLASSSGSAAPSTTRRGAAALTADDVPTYNPGNYAERRAAQEASNQRYLLRREIYQASIGNKAAAADLKEALRRKREGGASAQSSQSAAAAVAADPAETAADADTAPEESQDGPEQAKDETPKSEPDAETESETDRATGATGGLTAGSGPEQVTSETPPNKPGDEASKSPPPTSASASTSVSANASANGTVGTTAVTAPPEKNDDEPVDTVRLWEDGYEDRYYAQKFHVDPDDVAFRHKVGRAYVEGLCWVLLYYYQGCPSWTWYYPYHYAPFATNFVDIDRMQIAFEPGRPFRPYEQLMGVLPAASGHAIPPPFRSLMTDPDSDILDFYPVSFPIDLNGKKHAWQGVALLPFIDETRLLRAMAERYPLLSDDERARNEPGQDALLFSFRHPLYQQCTRTLYGKKGAESAPLDPAVSDGLAGTVARSDSFLPDAELLYPLGTAGSMPDLLVNNSMTVQYALPAFAKDDLHQSVLLPGARPPRPVVDKHKARQHLERIRHGGNNGGGGHPRQTGHSGYAGHSYGGERAFHAGKDDGSSHRLDQPAARSDRPDYSRSRYAPENAGYARPDSYQPQPQHQPYAHYPYQQSYDQHRAGGPDRYVPPTNSHQRRAGPPGSAGGGSSYYPDRHGLPPPPPPAPGGPAAGAGSGSGGSSNRYQVRAPHPASFYSGPPGQQQQQNQLAFDPNGPLRAGHGQSQQQQQNQSQNQQAHSWRPSSGGYVPPYRYESGGRPPPRGPGAGGRGGVYGRR